MWLTPVLVSSGCHRGRVVKGRVSPGKGKAGWNWRRGQESRERKWQQEEGWGEE